MAPRAIHWRIDVFFANDLLADYPRVAIRNPIELGDQLSRPKVRRRVLVAIEAEGHVERLLLMDLNLLIDASVAGNAAHARVQMGFVVKVDVIGKTMNVH